MNDIVLNGETLDIGQRFDTIVIEGFDHLFDQNKMESNLVINAGGGNIKPSLTTFEANGTYDPSTVGYDGFGMICVDVEARTKSLTATENGLYYPGANYDGYSMVNVNVPNPILAVQNVWQGLRSEYEALTPSDDTLYIIKIIYNGGNSIAYNENMIEDICIGSYSFFRSDAYWDYCISNYSSPRAGFQYYSFYFLDTGFEIENQDNYDREFEIEFTFYPDKSVGFGDRIICGCGLKSENFKELYCDEDGCLYFSTSGNDSMIYSGDISGRTVVLKRENRNSTLYYTFRFFEETEPFHEREIRNYTSSTTLGIGKYREYSYTLCGELEFFAFKWLT